MVNKEELIKRYKPIKNLSMLLLGLWCLGILIAIIALVLAIIPNVGMSEVKTGQVDADGKEITKMILNDTGKIILGVMGGGGVLIALIPQFVIPYLMKKHLIKIQDQNYPSLSNYLNKCYSSPFGGSINLIKQIDWVINSKEESDKQVAEIQDYLKNKQLTRLEKEKLEQDRIDKMYANENETLGDNKQETVVVVDEVEKESKKQPKNKNTNSKTKKNSNVKKATSSKSKSTKSNKSKK